MRRVMDSIRRAWYYGEARVCPICGRGARRFLRYGQPARREARCVHCGALERHRLTWVFLQKRTDFFETAPERMLHVAPEDCLRERISDHIGPGYLSADLNSPLAMERMDITDIQHPDASFDVIFCNHVLEHVGDDRAALSELFRVLRPGGWAILNVPVFPGVTFEDPSITDPVDRKAEFGQEDHVRRYGQDYIDRLRAAGFQVEVTAPEAIAKRPERERLGLGPASGEVFFCRKL